MVMIALQSKCRLSFTSPPLGEGAVCVSTDLALRQLSDCCGGRERIHIIPRSGPSQRGFEPAPSQTFMLSVQSRRECTRASEETFPIPAFGAGPFLARGSSGLRTATQPHSWMPLLLSFFPSWPGIHDGLQPNPLSVRSCRPVAHPQRQRGPWLCP
jgi:hypothetical protein